MSESDHAGRSGKDSQIRRVTWEGVASAIREEGGAAAVLHDSDFRDLVEPFFGSADSLVSFMRRDIGVQLLELADGPHVEDVRKSVVGFGSDRVLGRAAQNAWMRLDTKLRHETPRRTVAHLKESEREAFGSWWHYVVFECVHIAMRKPHLGDTRERDGLPMQASGAFPNADRVGWGTTVGLYPSGPLGEQPVAAVKFGPPSVDVEAVAPWKRDRARSKRETKVRKWAEKNFAWYLLEQDETRERYASLERAVDEFVFSRVLAVGRKSEAVTRLESGQVCVDVMLREQRFDRPYWLPLRAMAFFAFLRWRASLLDLVQPGWQTGRRL